MLKDDLKNYLPEMNSWLIPRENGMLLSDYQVEVLAKYGIDYKKYGSIKEILFEINDILDEDDGDLDDLEAVSKELDEKNYYRSKKN